MALYTTWTIGRRPLRDGLSLRGGKKLRRALDKALSPSFAGRPFIEGHTRLAPRRKLLRRRPLRDGLSLRGSRLTPCCTVACGRRPLRDGLSLRVPKTRDRAEWLEQRSPSFAGRPFIEGSLGVAICGGRFCSRRPLRDGLSLRAIRPRRDRSPEGWSPSFAGRPFIEGRTARRGSGHTGGSPSFAGRPFIEGGTPAGRPRRSSRCRRPLRDGLSLRERGTTGETPPPGRSPSFAGRPFIEGVAATYHGGGTAESPSFAGRPFIEGCVDRARRNFRWLSPSFAGRPFIEGRKNDLVARRREMSPSFAGRPFIEGCVRVRLRPLRLRVAVLCGTAFH